MICRTKKSTEKNKNKEYFTSISIYPPIQRPLGLLTPQLFSVYWLELMFNDRTKLSNGLIKSASRSM